MKLTLVIPAIPVAQPRPRAVLALGRARVHEVTSIKGSDGTRRPHPIAAFKATCRQILQAHYRDAPYAGPVSMEIDFVFPRPRAMCWKKRPMPREKHTHKPDADNVLKALLDAWLGLLFVDDGQVFCVTARKWIASGGEQPHVRVEVELQ